MANSHFTEQEISERYRDIFSILDGFCDIFNENADFEVEIDPSQLYLAVVATYDDIARYKDYHLVDPQHQRSNAVKRAAYAAKWVMHFNPIIVPKSGHLTGVIGSNHPGLANAIFAVHFMLVNIEEFSGKRVNLTDKIYHSLLYDLMYRSVGGDALILVFDIIASMASGDQVITPQAE